MAHLFQDGVIVGSTLIFGSSELAKDIKDRLKAVWKSVLLYTPPQAAVRSGKSIAMEVK
jgi:hypothetical protein